MKSETDSGLKPREGEADEESRARKGLSGSSTEPSTMQIILVGAAAGF